MASMHSAARVLAQGCCVHGEDDTDARGEGDPAARATSGQ